MKTKVITHKTIQYKNVVASRNRLTFYTLSAQKCDDDDHDYDDDHRLNDSSSPVLTATCLSYGRLCDFLTFFSSTDLEVTPLDRF